MLNIFGRNDIRSTGSEQQQQEQGKHPAIFKLRKTEIETNKTSQGINKTSPRHGILNRLRNLMRLPVARLFNRKVTPQFKASVPVPPTVLTEAHAAAFIEMSSTVMCTMDFNGKVITANREFVKRMHTKGETFPVTVFVE